MKLNKKLAQYKFVIGCVGTDNRDYEQYARITMWRLGSNTFKIIAEEFDVPNGIEFEKFICGKKKSQIIWGNLLYKYSGLEEVYRANPY